MISNCAFWPGSGPFGVTDHGEFSFTDAESMSAFAAPVVVKCASLLR